MTITKLEVGGKARWALCALVLATLISSSTVAFLHTKWWVINTDGGWYSYPAYAMSEGRDPGENMLSPDRVSLDTPGVRSVFHWENRSFLLTRLLSGWFSIAGHGHESIVLFGLSQWIGCAALAWALIWYASGSYWASTAGAMALLADSNFIWECFSDLRPDVLLALLSLGCLGFLFRYIRSRGYLDLAAGGLLLLMLPLVHTTGVLPLAALLAYIGLIAIVGQRGKSHDGNLRLPLVLLIVASAAVVAFRQTILDVLVPTQVPLEVEVLGRHNLVADLHAILSRGVVDKAVQEGERWREYFRSTNFAQVLFLVTGIYGVILRGNPATGDKILRTMLLAGWLVGVIAITCLDSHSTPSHLISLVALGYVIAGIGWARLLDDVGRAERSRAVAALVSIGVMIFVLKSVQAIYVISNGVTQDVSGEAVRALAKHVLPTSGDPWVIGPTSIWLYAPADARCIVVDKREDPSVIQTKLWKHVAVLIIDSDFLKYGWGSVAQDGVTKGWLYPIGRVGHPSNSIYYMEAFRVVHTEDR
jgi:hypothetical protein